MKKKKYIREGGICQFWDNWAENGSINHQKLSHAIFHPETIKLKEQERSEEFYIVEKMKDSDESSQEEKTEEIKPFNREYKNYDTKN